MCNICEQEARNVADRLAEVNASRFAGHGRAPHGRDAGRRVRNAERDHARNVEDAWQQLYQQTLATNLRRPHPLP